MRYLYLLLFLVACTPAEVHPKYKVGDCLIVKFDNYMGGKILKVGKFTYKIKYIDSSKKSLTLIDFIDSNAKQVDCDPEFFPEEKKQ